MKTIKELEKEITEYKEMEDEKMKQKEEEIWFLNWIYKALINNSQITFDNKSIIFENRLEEFNVITDKIKERIDVLTLKDKT